MSAPRTAKPEDAPRIIAILEEAKAFLRAQRVDQWQNGYPNADVVRADIARGESLVFERDGRVAATACVSFAGEPTYARVYGGAWHYEEPYAVVHRIAVSQSFRGCGVGAEMLAQIEALARARGVYALRADTHEDNRPMQRLLEKAGFQYCGTIYLSDGSARRAYDRKKQGG